MLPSVFSNVSRSQARDRVDTVAQQAGWQVPDWYLELKAVAVPILASAAAMGAAAHTAGLADIVVEDRPVDVRITEPEQLVSYRLGQPLFASWLDRVGPRGATDIASHAADAIRPIMQPYRPIVVFLAATTQPEQSQKRREGHPLLFALRACGSGDLALLAPTQTTTQDAASVRLMPNTVNRLAWLRTPRTGGSGRSPPD